MLRVGSVPYLVARPLDERLEGEPGIALTREVPAQLVEGLRSGRLDVALVSSVELFRRPGYTYLEGPAVVGDGHVSSVQVFLRRPLEELGSVALDPASRASAALVRALLAERGLAPRWDVVPLGEDPRARQADAWLRIGDLALRETFAAGAPPTFNPSAAWRERTELPFVFALWIARPGVDLEPWAETFERASAHGATRIEALADDAARRWDLPREAARRYLAEECRYGAAGGLAPSLDAFRSLLLAHDLALPDAVPEPAAGPPPEGLDEPEGEDARVS